MLDGRGEGGGFAESPVDEGGYGGGFGGGGGKGTPSRGPAPMSDLDDEIPF